MTFASQDSDKIFILPQHYSCIGFLLVFILNNQSAELNFVFNAKSLLFSINDHHFSWLWKLWKLKKKMLSLSLLFEKVLIKLMSFLLIVPKIQIKETWVSRKSDTYDVFSYLLPSNSDLFLSSFILYVLTFNVIHPLSW